MKSFLIRNENEFNFNYLELGTKGDLAWATFTDGLINVFRECFKDNSRIVSHDLKTIKEHVYQKVNGSPTISIDPCIKGDINFGISHVYSQFGAKSIKLSNRPGFPALDDQMAKIPPGDYLLIEDDTFSGETINHVVDIFSKRKINIKSVIVSIQVGNPITRVPIEGIYFYLDKDVIDLNNPRDVFAGGFEGGLIVQDFDLNSKQHYTVSRVPCLLPFADISTRLSIPSEKALDVSKKIWGLNTEFWATFPQVTIANVDKYFSLTALNAGYKPSDSMFFFCNCINKAL